MAILDMVSLCVRHEETYCMNLSSFEFSNEKNVVHRCVCEQPLST